MGPNPIWPLTLKEGGRRCEDRDVGRSQSLVTGRGCRDAPRGQACRQPPGLGGQGQFYPESQRGVAPWHLDCRLQASGLREELLFLLFKCSSLWDFAKAAPGH